MILDPVGDISDGDHIGGRISEVLLWHFWPRMRRSQSVDRRLRCQLEIDGVPYDIPEPEECPPLDLFCAAAEEARSTGPRSEAVYGGRNRRLLGRIAVCPGWRGRRRRLVPAEETIFPENAAHIALMRPVELVVRYEEGTKYADPGLEWAGVFIADEEEETERAFARSEPPAHDDWAWQSMPKGEPRTWVKRACEQIRQKASSVVAVPEISADTGESGPSLAALSGRMGALLGGAAEGAGPRTPADGARGTRRSLKVLRPVFARLELDEGAPVAVFETVVRQDRAGSGAVLVCEASWAADGGALRTDDADMARPRIISIRSTDGSLEAPGRRLTIAGAEGAFEIRVRMSAEAAVTVDARLEKGTP